MTINYSTLLGLTKPVTGTQSGTWGDDVNTGLTDYLDAAIAGAQVISGSQTAVTLTKTVGTSSAPTTLVQAGSGASGSSQYQVIQCTGNPASLLTITVPAADKTYIVINATSTSQSVKVVGTGPTTGVTIAAGEKAVIAWNGSDFVKVATANGTGEFTTVDTTNLEVTNIKAKDGTAAATIADSTGIITVSTQLNVDNLNFSVNTISSTDTNGNIVLAPNGTGDVQVDADTLRVGDSGAAATITTNGAGNLTISTNAGTNSGTIVINQGTNGNIEVAPNGTGDVYLTADTVRIGDSNANATLTTNGTGDLILNTNSGTNSGSITIADGAGGDITATPNGNGSVVITNSGTSNALRITQTGSGNALLVEDSSNPDASPFVIDASGNVIKGSTSLYASLGATPQVQFNGTGVGDSTFAINSWRNSSASGGLIALNHSKSGIVGTFGTLASGDSIGSLVFSGDDGTSFIQSASISAAVDDTPGTNDMPGRLSLATTADGASSPTERVRINSAGLTTVGYSAATGAALSTTVAAKLLSANTTYTDSATAASGTVTHGTINSFDNPAIAASNASVTYTNASTVYIDGAPTAGSNVTITNPYALYVAAGATYLGGNLTLSGGTANGVLYLDGSKVATSGSALTFDGTNFLVNGVASGSAISGSASVVAIRDLATSNVSSFKAIGGSSATQIELFGSGTLTGLWTSTNTPMVFATNNAEQMRLTSTGLGIGTSSPGYKLTVAGGATSLAANQYLRFGAAPFAAGDGSVTNYLFSGTTSMTWRNAADSADLMYLSNGGNLGLGVTPSAWGSAYKTIQFGIDGVLNATTTTTNGVILGKNFFNNGSGNLYINTDYASFYQQITGQHQWFTAPSGTAGNTISFTQAMTLTAAGRLGVGQTSPGVAFSVAGQSEAWQIAFTTASGTAGGLIGSPAADVIAFGNWAGSERARITSGGEFYIAGTTDQGAYNLQCNGTGVWGAGAYVNGSDERLKDDIQSLDSCLNVVNALRPVTFKYKPEHSKDQSIQTGFIAQELQQVLAGKPYLEGLVQEGPQHLNVAYQNIIPLLTKAIQEQQALIESLTFRVAQLEGTQP
jgi:hypothetical protein